MKSIALLSGGLDCLVSLAAARKDSEIVLAICFDYGQKAVQSEKKAAQDICGHYSIPLKVIKLDWLSAITNTALVNKKEQVPKVEETDLDRKIEITQNNAKAVWVPNRNAVFINIAAAHAESMGAHQIVTGFNSEEAATFPDNSIQFISAVNQSLRLSTMSKPKVVSYVQSFNKSGIVNTGIKLGVPFHLIYSCYNSSKTGKMCGQCESCARTKRAFRQTGKWELIKDRFPEEEANEIKMG